MKSLVGAIGLILGASTLSPALAQNVYRCGNSYSSLPCADAKVVAADDARSVEQQAEARRLADEERRRGDRMEQERLAAAAATVPMGAGSLSPPPPAAKPSLPKHGASVVHRRHAHKARPEDDPNRFSAAEPGSGKKKPKPSKA